MSAPAANAVPEPGRISAETVRLVRIFHRLDRTDLAATFGVSVRTVFRWERDGVDPGALQLDPGARSGPDWRRKLMIWMVERYRDAAVSDTRKKEG